MWSTTESSERMARVIFLRILSSVTVMPISVAMGWVWNADPMERKCWFGQHAACVLHNENYAGIQWYVHHVRKFAPRSYWGNAPSKWGWWVCMLSWKIRWGRCSEKSLTLRTASVFVVASQVISRPAPLLCCIHIILTKTVFQRTSNNADLLVTNWDLS